LTNNVFERNTAWYPLGSDWAGAIGCQSSPSIIMIGNIFRDNFAGSGGGGGTIFSADSVVIISNVFKNNSAWSAGGGLAVGVSDGGIINDTHVKISIYDVLGGQTRALIDDVYISGEHIVEWDGKDNSGNEAASGFYFYRFEADDFSDIRKMLMLK